MAHLPSDQAIVKSLIATLQREVKPEKLFEALERTHNNLVRVYQTLFEGPLPAVDGNQLFNLNAANLTGGPIPEDVLGPVALLNANNNFELSQYVVGEDVFVAVGTGDLTALPEVPATTYIRLGTISDSRGYLSHNLAWTGANYAEDDNQDGGVIEFVNDEILLYAYDGLNLIKTFRFKEIELRINNPAQTVEYAFVTIDAQDRILLGESATSTGKGHICIPAKSSINIPTASADTDGIIMQDTTNNRLIFFQGGARYYVQGTAF